MKKKNARGFTMLELMFYVAIVGLLASVALPEYTRFRYRAQLSEAELNVNAMVRMLQLQMSETNGGGLPTAINFGGFSLAFLNAPPNPPLPPGRTRRTFDGQLGDWVAMPTTPSGQTAFSYTVTALKWSAGGVSGQEIEIYAFADLDGDGVWAQRCQLWSWDNGDWVLLPASDLCNTGIGAY